MRRRPKDIKLKDFISDEATKKKLVKMAAPAKERLDVSNGEILSFLRESRSLSEVSRHFGYTSMKSAYTRLHKLMKTGEVVRLSYGLYRAQGDVTVFGIGDLSEREAQERGLEAYQRKLRELEQAQQSEAPGTPAPTVPKIPSNYSRKLRSILEYIQVPRTTREIADHFGYHNTSPVTPILHMFVRDGLVKLTRDKRTSSPYTAVRIGDWPSPSTPSPESVTPAPVPEVADQSQDQTTSSLPTPEEAQGVSPDNHIVVDLRQLAMEFLWSLEPGAELGTPTGVMQHVMQRFVAWHDERLNHEAKS